MENFNNRLDHASKYVTIGRYGLEHPGTMGFKPDKPSIRISNISNERIEFDCFGIDVSLANSLRRIMIAEIPSMAIETVGISQNSSIIQDEILAHRIGLLPIKVDPRKFSYPEKVIVGTNTGENPTVGDPKIISHLKFNLSIKCTKKEGVDTPNNENILKVKAETLYNNSSVYAEDLEWEPLEGQLELLEGSPVKIVYDKILLAKMRPGQSIELEAMAVKGIGADHAKFSPVATATYKLLPDPFIKTVIKGEKAAELVSICPMNVFDIEDAIGSSSSKKSKSKSKSKSKGVAVVARPRNCTMCRECIRKDDFESLIELRRKKNHFLFSVETVGAYESHEIFIEACNVLKAKCKGYLRLLSDE